MARLFLSHYFMYEIKKNIYFSSISVLFSQRANLGLSLYVIQKNNLFKVMKCQYIKKNQILNTITIATPDEMFSLCLSHCLIEIYFSFKMTLVLV